MAEEKFVGNSAMPGIAGLLKSISGVEEILGDWTNVIEGCFLEGSEVVPVPLLLSCWDFNGGGGSFEGGNVT